MDRTQELRLRSELAGLRLLIALRRHEVKYRSDQPRIPASQSGGGRFTDGSESVASEDRSTEIAARRIKLTPRQIRECHVAYDQDVRACQIAMGVEPFTYNPGNIQLEICYTNAAVRLGDCLTSGRVGESMTRLFSGVK